VDDYAHLLAELIQVDERSWEGRESFLSRNGKKKIRLLHVLRVFGLGGMEHGVINLLNRIDRNVFDPIVCCTYASMDDARSLLSTDIPVVDLNCRLDRVDFNIVPKLRKVIRDHSIDIVHSHNWSTFIHAVPAAHLAGAPVIIHGEHGRDTVNPDTEFKQRMAWRILGPVTDEFIAVSENIREELENIRGIPSWKIHFIPNGVDTDRYRPDPHKADIRRRLGVVDGEKVIGIVGGLRKIKGHEFLIEALKLVKKEVGPVRLYIVGGPHGELDSEPRIRELRCFAEKLGLRDEITFTGARRDIQDWMRAFDVYVNCSLYEGMCNSILEAMASGTPVVATSVGGTVRIIEDGKTGLLVPPNDPVALADAVCRILKNPELAVRLGREGREHTQKHHSLSRMVEMNQEIYLSAMARKTVRPSWHFSQRVRKVVGESLAFMGVLGLMGRLSRSNLCVITYHRVLPADRKACAFNQPMIVEEKVFKRQMAFLASKYTPVSLEVAIAGLRGETPLPDRPVLVTFDDGYRDNYLYAYPVMRHYGIPAAIFVTTNHIDTGSPFWWDWLAEGLFEMARNGHMKDIEKSLREAVPSIQWSCCFDARHRETVDRLIRELKCVDSARRTAVLDSFRDMMAQIGIFRSPERIVLNWDEIIEMDANGISVGSHTASHLFLDESGQDDIAEDLRIASERIREKTGKRPVAISYPDGRIAAGQEEVIRRAGFVAGFVSKFGLNPVGCDMYSIQRIDAGFLAIGNSFYENLMHMEMQNVLRR